MMFPVYIADNFYPNLSPVLELSNNLEYKDYKDKQWPGLRTDPLHSVNKTLFDNFNNKVLSLIYPDTYQDLIYTANTYFQKVSSTRHPGMGWIHTDPCDMTAILYLSKHTNCGTSLWTRKKYGPKYYNHKYKFFRNKKYNKEEEIYKKLNNESYKKILSVDSMLNRLIIFPGAHHHAAENFEDKNIKEDRLTLITFIYNLKTNANQALKYPLNQCRNID